MLKIGIHVAMYIYVHVHIYALMDFFFCFKKNEPKDDKLHSSFCLKLSIQYFQYAAGMSNSILQYKYIRVHKCTLRRMSTRARTRLGRVVEANYHFSISVRGQV